MAGGSFPLDVDQLMSDFRTQLLMALYGPLQQRILRQCLRLKDLGEANQQKILRQIRLFTKMRLKKL